EHNAISLNDIIGNFYDEKEQVEISFKSSKGTYDEKTKKVILNGDNLFVSKDGSQLYADELIWQGRDKDILANGNVQFIQEDKLLVKAQKARFNSSLTKFKVMGNTKTRVYTDKETKKKYTQL
ncbi:LPS export ABC transporter periplasmic protein LptC, partial [bacterium]|nr:LPS export ABC transporter periplasmic protein LptC [bacterium]